MARHTLARLTAKEVATKSKVPGRHADGGGLYLVTTKALSASWVYRYMAAGKSHDLGLGSLKAIGLKDAREKAARLRRMRALDEPQDPATERQARRLAGKLGAAKAMTFAECARSYIAAHRAGWKNGKHAAQWSTTLERYAFPLFGALPVQAIDTGLVMKVVEPLWATKTETASRVRGRIESVLDWAAARDYRQGDNPARWRGLIENLVPKKSKVRAVVHHAALPYAAVPSFMAELGAEQGVAARALQFTILTAARTGEVLGARWNEFDLANRVWTVPGERMKHKNPDRPHLVPLSDQAVAIIDRLPRSGEFVFPGITGTRPMAGAAMLLLLRRISGGRLTVHGLRSSFRDWAAEETSFPSEVVEMALAHGIENQVEAAYRRGDLREKRRALAEAWSAYCSNNPGDNIVALRAVQ